MADNFNKKRPPSAPGAEKGRLFLSALDMSDSQPADLAGDTQEFTPFQAPPTPLPRSLSFNAPHAPTMPLLSSGIDFDFEEDEDLPPGSPPPHPVRQASNKPQALASSRPMAKPLASHDDQYEMPEPPSADFSGGGNEITQQFPARPSQQIVGAESISDEEASAGTSIIIKKQSRAFEPATAKPTEIRPAIPATAASATKVAQRAEDFDKSWADSDSSLIDSTQPPEFDTAARQKATTPRQTIAASAKAHSSGNAFVEDEESFEHPQDGGFGVEGVLPAAPAGKGANSGKQSAATLRSDKLEDLFGAEAEQALPPDKGGFGTKGDYPPPAAPNRKPGASNSLMKDDALPDAFAKPAARKPGQPAKEDSASSLPALRLDTLMAADGGDEASPAAIRQAARPAENRLLPDDDLPGQLSAAGSRDLELPPEGGFSDTDASLPPLPSQAAAKASPLGQGGDDMPDLLLKSHEAPKKGSTDNVGASQLGNRHVLPGKLGIEQLRALGVSVDQDGKEDRHAKPQSRRQAGKTDSFFAKETGEEAKLEPMSFEEIEKIVEEAAPAASLPEDPAEMPMPFDDSQDMADKTMAMSLPADAASALAESGAQPLPEDDDAILGRLAKAQAIGEKIAREMENKVTADESHPAPAALPAAAPAAEPKPQILPVMELPDDPSLPEPPELAGVGGKSAALPPLGAFNQDQSDDKLMPVNLAALAAKDKATTSVPVVEEQKKGSMLGLLQWLNPVKLAKTLATFAAGGVLLIGMGLLERMGWKQNWRLYITGLSFLIIAICSGVWIGDMLDNFSGDGH